MARSEVACACGCGKTFIDFDGDGRLRRFVSGHNTTPEFAKSIRAKFAMRPDAKDVLRQNGKKAWSNTAYRQRMAESNQRQWADPAFRKKTLSAARGGIKRKWAEDADYRKRMSISGKQQIVRLRNDEDAMRRHGEIQSKRLNALWKTPEWIAKISKAHAHQCGTLRTSRPEKRLRAFLLDNDIGFETNRRFILERGYTVPDIFIESIGLAIFTDGTYWHGKPAKKQRDREQRAALERMGICVFVIDQGKPETPQFAELLNTYAQRMRTVSDTLLSLL